VLALKEIIMKNHRSSSFEQSNKIGIIRLCKRWKTCKISKSLLER